MAALRLCFRLFALMVLLLSGTKISGATDNSDNSTYLHLQQAIRANDSAAVLKFGTAMAIHYYGQYDIDSAKHYMNLIAPYEDHVHDNKLSARINVLKGTIAISLDLDYTKAVMYFIRGLNQLDREDVINKSLVLSNITHLFYIRSDKQAKKYMNDIQRLAAELPEHSIGKYALKLSISEIQYLNGNYDEAFLTADSVRTDVKGSYPQFLPMANLILADICLKNKNFKDAEAYYEEAVKYATYEEPGTSVLAYLRYGNFYEATGRPDSAILMYDRGLKVSHQYCNAEFRDQLLHRLAYLYYVKGDKDLSLKYYRDHHIYLDSISLSAKEQEFDDFISSYIDLEHSNELHSKEVALLKSNRKLILLLAVVVLVLILASFFLILYAKQRKQYKVLVQQYRQRSNQMTHANDGENTALQPLFKQLEKMMQHDKIYKNKELSLEKCAELLGSNRTYVSKVINSCAGMTFPRFLDMYRIKEATTIISEDKNNIPFKQLAEIVGYNSESVFYRAFSRETGCTPGQYKRGSKGL